MKNNAIKKEHRMLSVMASKRNGHNNENGEKLQSQYDLIYCYFKTTTEPYDELDWDGEELNVIKEGDTIEIYTLNDLNKIIPKFLNL